MNKLERHQKALVWRKRRTRWMGESTFEGMTPSERARFESRWEKMHNCSCSMCRGHTRKVWGNGRQGKSIQELRLG